MITPREISHIENDIDSAFCQLFDQIKLTADFNCF